MATTATTPRLRVVGGAKRQRHEVAWEAAGYRYAAEVWTDAEWADLPEWERPDQAMRCDGFGWVLVYLVGPADLD